VTSWIGFATWAWRIQFRDQLSKRHSKQTIWEKLKGLIAKFEAAIQAHDAKVAAAQAAL
jgi:hypothetical protein